MVGHPHTIPRIGCSQKDMWTGVRRGETPGVCHPWKVFDGLAPRDGGSARSCRWQGDAVVDQQVMRRVRGGLKVLKGQRKEWVQPRDIQLGGEGAARRVAREPGKIRWAAAKPMSACGSRVRV
jgi:hypothetical protein